VSAGIDIEVEPGDVGLDAGRLDRIARHLTGYVDDGRLPGWLVVVARHGKIAHVASHGWRDVEAGLPIEPDTIFRIYSMTKPITSVAAMMLHEEGAFELKTPISDLIPSFADARVYRAGPPTNPETEPLLEPVRVWHLLTHTAGLTYGFHHAHPVDAMYRKAGFEWGSPPGMTLAEATDAFAGLPLLFQPGTEWNYGVSTDVLGRVVEAASGQSLDRFFAERIFEPLGMTDTAFSVPAAKQDRLAALYVAMPGQPKAVRLDAMGNAFNEPPAYLSGGGGLVSTAGDYHRFTQLLARGGELDGVRLLGPRTLGSMASNHLPGDVDLEAFGRPLFGETTFEGVGFGLGLSVTLDPVKNKVPGSVGDFGWGGAASTYFWIDPVDNLAVTFFTQLLPSSTHPIRSELKQLVRQAIVA